MKQNKKNPKKLKKSDCYNKRSIYKEKIEPIINELKIVCNLEKMPMFVTVAVENSIDGTSYESELILSSTDTDLTDKAIANILLRMNGFEKKYPENVENALREINTYLNSISLNGQKKETVKVKLADDRLPDLIGIVEGGDTSVPPSSTVSKPISEEEFDAICAPKESIIKY